MNEYPDVVQVEVTNRCNFNCIMCIRNFWKETLGDMPFDLYKKLAREAFPNIKRATLYGYGEPLINPNFIEMTKIARELLPTDGTIFFSTNGSLLSPKVADKLLKEIGVDSISFSIDSFDFVKLKDIRVGVSPALVFKNLKYISSIKHQAKRDFKLGIEVTLMKANLNDLPRIIETAASWNIDYVTVSHVLPYNEHFYNEVLYLTISKQSLDLSKDILKYGWDLILKSIYEYYSLAFWVPSHMNATKTLKDLWTQAREKGTELNPNLVILEKDKIMSISDIERIFNRARKMATKYGITVDLPDIIPDEKRRVCPYIEKNATVVRYDGEVSPCFNYLYTHPTYVNRHLREDKHVSFGNIKNQTLKEIWNSDKYVKFREILSDMPKNTPWCGTCPFSTTECWYTKTNDYDCYGNSPSCSECLYSVNLVKCII
ncbi:MAG: radical SAM protein [Candidatus Asgardarchaeia archaeon]